MTISIRPRHVWQLGGKYKDKLKGIPPSQVFCGPSNGLDQQLDYIIDHPNEKIRVVKGIDDVCSKCPKCTVNLQCEDVIMRSKQLEEKEYVAQDILDRFGIENPSIWVYLGGAAAMLGAGVILYNLKEKGYLKEKPS